MFKYTLYTILVFIFISFLPLINSKIECFTRSITYSKVLSSTYEETWNLLTISVGGTDFDLKVPSYMPDFSRFKKVVKVGVTSNLLAVAHHSPSNKVREVFTVLIDYYGDPKVILLSHYDSSKDTYNNWWYERGMPVLTDLNIVRERLRKLGKRDKEIRRNVEIFLGLTMKQKYTPNYKEMIL